VIYKSPYRTSDLTYDCSHKNNKTYLRFYIIQQLYLQMRNWQQSSHCYVFEKMSQINQFQKSACKWYYYTRWTTKNWTVFRSL